MGVLMAKHLKQLKPKGGTRVPAAGQRRRRQHQRPRRGLPRHDLRQEGIDQAEGRRGWTEIEGCPLFTNDQIDLANQQMADVFTRTRSSTPSSWSAAGRSSARRPMRRSPTR
jgi:ribose transport system substrate-binding protein